MSKNTILVRLRHNDEKWYACWNFLTIFPLIILIMILVVLGVYFLATFSVFIFSVLKALYVTRVSGPSVRKQSAHLVGQSGITRHPGLSPVIITTSSASLLTTKHIYLAPVGQEKHWFIEWL